MKKFSKNFTWGTSTSSYQIEGAWNLDGKGESIWDRFTHAPGHIERSENGDIACDHYHRYREDIELMSRLGIPAYRFSISWPRILPQGKGAINQRGLDFYNKLVDALLEKGIEPWITLYHWDLPQALEDQGGWPNRVLTDYFQNYAGIMVKQLGDRVKHWMTLNEPWVISFLGYRDGVVAPGRKNRKSAFQCAYHLLLAHGKAYSAMKALNSKLTIGITNVHHNYISFTRDEQSLRAAAFEDMVNNKIFLDPVLKGTYPQLLVQLRKDAPIIDPEDFKIMRQTDFMGIQYYHDVFLINGKKELPATIQEKFPIYEYTEMGWPITPVGIFQQLMLLYREYGVKNIVITENGSAWPDVLDPEGNVRDEKRQKYLLDHLGQVHRAMEHGAPVTGYFVWSFMDNFEWTQGYRPRFGLVYTDYATQNRYIKDSARLFSTIIKENGIKG